MKTKSITITPRGASQPCVEEAAAVGEARVARNVRECDGALRVVGTPFPIGAIPAGERLLLVDGDRMLTLSDNQVKHDGQVLATLDGEVVGCHRVGSIVVVTTTAGIIWLRHNGTGYVRVTLDGACPDITLSALEWDTPSAAMEAVTFAAPYANWPTTLVTSDVSRLTTMLRQAWNGVQQMVDAAGAYAGMMRVRCGVRLLDDTYLWLSDPVTLGSETLADSVPVNAEAVLDGTTVTGIPATTLTRHRYRLGITVLRGIADDWMPLVRAVDILATGCVSPVVTTATAQYRTIGIGGSVRRPQLEFGLPAVSQGTINAQLAQSGWHVVASTTDLNALAVHQWTGDNVATTTETVAAGVTSYVVTATAEDDDRLSAAQASALEQSLTPLVPVASMTSNGRLYCVDATGVLAVSEPGNPLVTARQQTLTGATVRAVMPMGRAIYSGGFGRYPVVLFTDEGIYALPQTTAGASFGEPRLLDRVVLAQGCRPVEGERDLYFVSRRGHLCRLRGGTVETVWRDVGSAQLAWDDAHRELWVLTSDGTMLAVMPSGCASERTVAAMQLYGDNTHTLAVTEGGLVLDLTDEQDTPSQPVEWQSHPLTADAPHQVVWLVLGDATLSLEVRGERGASCHGFLVGRLRVDGSINAPLRQVLVAQPLRTIRLRLAGNAASRTILQQVTVGR